MFFIKGFFLDEKIFFLYIKKAFFVKSIFSLLKGIFLSKKIIFFMKGGFLYKRDFSL